MAELADALDLESSSSECRFNSCYPHHIESIGLIQKCQAFFIWNKRQKSLYSICHQVIASIEAYVYNEYLEVFSQNITTI
jgi:hypothetical protein